MNTLADSPAFPRLYARSDEDGRSGMTLRQHYAGLAMQGILANQPLTLEIYRHHPGKTGCEAIASEAAGMADALLAELEKH